VAVNMDQLQVKCREYIPTLLKLQKLPKNKECRYLYANSLRFRKNFPKIKSGLSLTSPVNFSIKNPSPLVYNLYTTVLLCRTTLRLILNIIIDKKK
jgi:hypothetical protein